VGPKVSPIPVQDSSNCSVSTIITTARDSHICSHQWNWWSSQ